MNTGNRAYRAPVPTEGSIRAFFCMSYFAVRSWIRASENRWQLSIDTNLQLSARLAPNYTVQAATGS